MSDESNILLCSRVTARNIVPQIPGTAQRSCGPCGHAVWVSPASLANIALRGPFEIRCLECAPDLTPTTLVLPISAGQYEELRTALKRDPL